MRVYEDRWTKGGRVSVTIAPTCEKTLPVINTEFNQSRHRVREFCSTQEILRLLFAAISLHC